MVGRQVFTLLANVVARFDAIRSGVALWRLEFGQVRKIRWISEPSLEHELGLPFLRFEQVQGDRPLSHAVLGVQPQVFK
jgi:hypothetical protein